MTLQFIQRHIRVIAAVSGVLPAVMVCDFLLLVTSLGFHWWLPAWGTATIQGLLICLVVLAMIYSLLSLFGAWLNARAYRKRGYTILVVRQLIASIEGFALLILCAAWGLLVLVGRPSILPLKLLGGVWIIGFLGFMVLQVYDLRRKRRNLS